MGRNRCHGKDYWISFPTTIHMSKSEWKRLRYLGHNFWSNHWIFKLSSVLELDIHTFPLVTRSAQSDFGKAFKWAIEFSLAQCPLKLNDHKRSITPSKPKKEKKKRKRKKRGYLEQFFGQFLSLSLSLSLKHIQKLLNSHSSHKSRVSALALISLSLVHTPWIWGLGVYM